VLYNHIPKFVFFAYQLIVDTQTEKRRKRDNKSQRPVFYHKLVSHRLVDAVLTANLGIG
jgi:hypothetical protein